MKIVTAILLFLSSCIAWLSNTISQTSQKPEDFAQTSAKSWLALTDSGKYTESWQAASAAFRTAVPQEASFTTTHSRA